MSLIIFAPCRFLGTKGENSGLQKLYGKMLTTLECARQYIFFTIVFETWDFDFMNLVCFFLKTVEFRWQIVIAIVDRILCRGIQ